MSGFFSPSFPPVLEGRALVGVHFYEILIDFAKRIFLHSLPIAPSGWMLRIQKVKSKWSQGELR